jgi:RecJ-like exonuclease
MNNWLKIGVPVIIAALLITASVGITLALTGKGVAGQSAVTAATSGQETATEYARGSQCANCAGNGQVPGTVGQDNSTGSVYVPKGATCPSCPGYIAGSVGQTTTNRGGCCGGR